MARGDFPSSKQDQYIVRFPEGMRDRIKELAKANGRSMNSEIVMALSVSLGDEDQISAKSDEAPCHLANIESLLRELVELQRAK